MVKNTEKFAFAWPIVGLVSLLTLYIITRGVNPGGVVHPPPQRLKWTVLSGKTKCLVGQKATTCFKENLIRLSSNVKKY